MNPLLLTDGYKTSHHKMYPKNTTLVYSNFTPRSVNYMPEGAKDIVVFGVQYTMKYIWEQFENSFFHMPKNIVIDEVKEYLSSYLGTDYDTSHFEALHDLGYLPVMVKALDEGTVITPKIPILTIYNTHPDFFWLPNFLETLISSLLWKPMHSASMGYAYKKILLEAARKTDKENLAFVDFQGHDFSFRGMQHPESAITSGLGFLTSFKGTDTIPALYAAKKYYSSKDVAFSVPASEHAVMTAYGKEDEIGAFRRLMKQYPTGILSVVSDSFDLWQVLTKFMPELKEEILARDGKLVIRPDSGDPVDILCGVKYEYFDIDENSLGDIQNTAPGVFTYEILSKTKALKHKDNIYSFKDSEERDNFINNNVANKGVIELLWDVFGGTVNEQGYKVLDSHIGAIYGDSITLERAQQINDRLAAKGFASTNWVAGIGSYSMGYATRDNQGSAVKATYCELIQGCEEFNTGEYSGNCDGVVIGREIFKDPITDDGTKKSAKGLLKVFRNEEGVVSLQDQVSWGEESEGLLTPVFKDGTFLKSVTLEEIRERLN